MKLVGYSDRFSAAPGETVRFMVSSESPTYRGDIVRLRHLDENPAGPGFRFDAVDSDIAGEYPGRPQPIHTGSSVVVPHDPCLDGSDGFTLHAWIFPTIPEKGVQGLLTKWCDQEQAGYALVLDEDGCLALWLASGKGQVERVGIGAGLGASRWYSVAATWDPATGEACLYQEPVVCWPLGDPSLSVAKTVEPGAGGTSSCDFLMAAYWRRTGEGDPVATAHFNGRIDSPRLYDRALSAEEIERLRREEDPVAADDLVANWDYSLDISSARVTDTSPQGLHGRAVNLPMRAAAGRNWSGREADFRARPSEYGAIHFHDDDLEDAGWETGFAWQVPEGLASGIYAARLRSGGEEDFVPFAARPARGRPQSRIAFLAPSVTYLAYANQQYNDPMRVELGRRDSGPVGRRDQYMRDHNLMSLYDMHSDGTGVCYSSRLRPIMNMKPGYRNAELSLAAGWPHGLNADFHLLDWMDAQGFGYDVISDDDLHLEGEELLAPYRVVVTGTHPEYWTLQMLDAMQSYQADGGRLMYLGGNGLYWVTSFHPERPHVIEVRRWGGTRAWEALPGEYHHSTTGELGGLWRLRNRARQKTVGVGFVAMGSGENRPYRRRPGSFNERAAFIFEGVGEDELIGDFPSLVYGHGAAGFEIDRLDHRLGTPAHALLLASSWGHSDDYQLAIEDQKVSGAPTGGSGNPLVRADMVYYEGPKGGAVFSVGSISWCGCLSWNGCDNNVSRITGNVLRRFEAG